MLYGIVLKNLKGNIKNYILFFISNIIAVAELFTFWGLKSIVQKSITDPTTAEVLSYDFWVSAGLVTIITMFLMIFSMKYYVKQRATDYSTFTMLGMRKKMSYLLMLAEYCVGWVCSFAIGLVFGNIILYWVQKALYHLYPQFIEINKVGFLVYRNTFLLSAGVMAIVFIGLLTWMESKDLGALMLKEEVQEKKPVSKIWLLFLVIGIVVIRMGVGLLFEQEFAYLSAHIVLVIGSMMVLTFGGAIFLELLKKINPFYIRRVVKLNQLYNKYQSNLMIVFILFVIHFFALTYINVEITSILPLDKYKENYPYDVLWMAQQKDETFSEQVIEKYDGTLLEIPMIRVTTRFFPEHIGISESNYKKLTGKSFALKDKEIVVGIEDHSYKKEEKISDEDFWDAYKWLFIGKYTDDKRDIDITSEKNSEEYQYVVKDIFTQSVTGQYSIDPWTENTIVFSDDYFAEKWISISNDPEESSVLELFTFSAKTKEQAWEELEQFAEENGVKEVSKRRPQSSIYSTDQFLLVQKMQLLFNLASKIFILLSLFLSGTFVMGIKIFSELPLYMKRYDFLECMGMRDKTRKKTLRFEVQSIFNIALGSGLAMGILYVLIFVERSKREGTILDITFWKYWGLIVTSYVVIQYVIGRIFAIYVDKKIRKGKAV